VVDDVSKDILHRGTVVVPLRAHLVEALIGIVRQPKDMLVRRPPMHPVGAVKLASAKHLAQDTLIDPSQSALPTEEREAELRHGLFDLSQNSLGRSLPDVEP